MSAPFAGPPSLPFDTADAPPTPRAASGPSIHDDLAALDAAAQALPLVLFDARGQRRHARLRRRASTPSCAPTTTTRARTGRRTSRTRSRPGAPTELAKLPTYYIMELDKSMAETVAPRCRRAGRDRGVQVADRGGARRLQRASTPAPASRAACNGTACRTVGRFDAELRAVLRPHHRRAVLLHRGQERLGRLPGAGRFEQMQTRPARACCGCHLVEGAGHWVQQEQPEAITRLLLEFLKRRVGWLKRSVDRNARRDCATCVGSSLRPAPRVDANCAPYACDTTLRRSARRCRRPEAVLAQHLGGVLAEQRRRGARRALREGSDAGDVGHGDRLGRAGELEPADRGRWPPPAAGAGTRGRCSAARA